MRVWPAEALGFLCPHMLCVGGVGFPAIWHNLVAVCRTPQQAWGQGWSQSRGIEVPPSSLDVYLMYLIRSPLLLKPRWILKKNKIKKKKSPFGALIRGEEKLQKICIFASAMVLQCSGLVGIWDPPRQVSWPLQRSSCLWTSICISLSQSHHWFQYFMLLCVLFSAGQLLCILQNFNPGGTEQQQQQKTEPLPHPHAVCFLTEGGGSVCLVNCSNSRIALASNRCSISTCWIKC